MSFSDLIKKASDLDKSKKPSHLLGDLDSMWGPPKIDEAKAIQIEAPRIEAPRIETPRNETPRNETPRNEVLKRKEKNKIIEISDNDFENLNKDENRFLLYLAKRLRVSNQKEVRIGKDEFVKEAKVNSGRFSETRMSLKEKMRIKYHQVLKDDPVTNIRRGVYYSLIEH